jgi:hypothetical protein
LGFILLLGLCSYLDLCIPSGLLPSGFTTKILHAFVAFVKGATTCPTILILLHPNIINEE